VVLRWVRVVCQGLEDGDVCTHIHCYTQRDVDLLQVGFKTWTRCRHFRSTRRCKYGEICQVRRYIAKCQFGRLHMIAPHVKFKVKSTHLTTKYEVVVCRVWTGWDKGKPKHSTHRFFTWNMGCWETSWNPPIEWFLKLVVGNGPEVVLQLARACINLANS